MSINQAREAMGIPPVHPTRRQRIAAWLRRLAMAVDEMPGYMPLCPSERDRLRRICERSISKLPRL